MHIYKQKTYQTVLAEVDIGCTMNVNDVLKFAMRQRPSRCNSCKSVSVNSLTAIGLDTTFPT